MLDRYVVEAELGRGAMGTVYRGKHTKLRRHVAIKIMHEHLLGQPELRERFRREAAAAGTLSHPNIVGVLDVGEVDGKPVLVMEYAQGRTLADAMDQPVPRVQMLRWVGQLLDALSHAHGMGLVHRDLKPDNVILVEEAGEEIARIVDFGVAILRAPDDPKDGMKLTATGMLVGTPQYMAPEQARAERVDHRADLYPLGIIIYEMIAGITPFDGTSMEVALAKIDNDPPPIEQRAPGVSIDRVLDAFMRRLLARDPDHRFATALTAYEVLQLLVHDRLAAATALSVIDVDRAMQVVWLPDVPQR